MIINPEANGHVTFNRLVQLINITNSNLTHTSVTTTSRYCLRRFPVGIKMTHVTSDFGEFRNQSHTHKLMLRFHWSTELNPQNLE